MHFFVSSQMLHILIEISYLKGEIWKDLVLPSVEPCCIMCLGKYNIKLPFTIHSCFGSLVTQLVEENKSRPLLPPSMFVFIGLTDSSSSIIESMPDCATVPHGCGWTWSEVEEKRDNP